MQQFKIALILVVCGLYATTVAADGCSVDGYFVNPTEPGRYFQCFGGQRYDYKCYNNYVFYKPPYGCIEPDTVSAMPSTPTEYPITGPLPLTMSSLVTTGCPNGDGAFAVAGDCRKYYTCGMGNRSENYDCGPGYKSTNIPGQYCVVAAAGECY